MLPFPQQKFHLHCLYNYPYVNNYQACFYTVQNTFWHASGQTHLSGLLQPSFYRLSFSEAVLHYTNNKTSWA